MSKKLTWRKPNGEWGIEGAELSALPPAVYAAVAKLHQLEYPVAPTKAEAIRAMTDEELAGAMAENAILSICEVVCGADCRARDGLNGTSREHCEKILLEYLKDPAR